GTSSVPAVTNFLGLRVTVEGRTYQGNNFDNGWSRPGTPPGPDREGWDNLQNVYLPAGAVTGRFEVVVRAINVTTNCMDGGASDPQQDFALVVANGHPDEGMTPIDLFILVDRDMSGAAPGDGDFWSDGSGDNDDDELDGNWWDDHDTKPSRERPILRRGARGADVEELQRLLQQAGYDPGPIDGIFGGGTQSAVRSFQRDQGLTVDGVVGPRTWAALDAATAGDGGGSSQDDDWWSDDWPDDWWEETPPATETVRRRETAVAALLAGTAVGGTDVQVLSPETITTEVGERVAAGPGGPDVTGAATAPLRDALRLLMSRWDDLESRARRLHAVIVVGSGTRIGRDDLRALRRLALRGELYLVSADRMLLRFLAQRLYLQRGVNLRAAPSEDRVPATAQAAAAEAAGSTQMLLRTESRALDVGAGTRVAFGVTDADRRIVLVIEASPDEIEVRIRPPGEEPATLPPRSHRRGLRLGTRPDGAAMIEIERLEDAPWAGPWELQVRSAGTTPPEVIGWAWSDLDLEAAVGNTPSSEAGENGETRVTVQGAPGVTLSRLRVVGPGGPVGETARDIEARRTPDRLDLLAAAMPDTSGNRPVPEEAPDGNGAAAETMQDRTLEVPSLDASIPLPERQRSGTLAFDVELAVAGSDPEGHRFDRRLHATVLRLQRRAEWRRQRSRRERLLKATVLQVRYGGDSHVTGLLLARDGRRRPVRIDNESLRTQLAGLDLLGQPVHVAVRGDRAVAVIRELRANGTTGSG
ncbi:MAG: peptidoglycan-binding domain-containing protein, partial [Actinomycetota bacterium]